MIVLIVNAIAILSEDRFLARIGWAAQQPEPAFGSGQDMSIKGKIVNLISATRLLARIPLIVINSVIIIYELLLG
ncbi:Yos1-like protein [Wilcoxina mikolae CBS 423.85]|nr:Yos1-like protein [Wilcoxina mikolae CBS 423.85]